MSREWAGGMGRYGAAGESGAWKVVYDHYYWDRLKEAYFGATELGAGQAAHGLVGFRMIEGEWVTRERGRTARINDWLQIEAISHEVWGGATPHPLPNPPPRGRGLDSGSARSDPDVGSGVLPAMAIETIVDACDEVATRFGFEHGAPVLLSVLAEESNVPWMPGRHGYCIDKHPYDKICVPAYSLRDHDDLVHVVQHEYAHVVSLNLSRGHCPHWLDEAVAMVAGGGVERRAWRLLAAGVAPWRSPIDLDLAYTRNREDDAERNDVWLAYQQSAVLGFYLSSLKGERALGSLLRGFANNSFLSDVWMRVQGRSEADEALHEVYGLGEEEAFARAFEWLVAQG